MLVDIINCASNENKGHGKWIKFSEEELARFYVEEQGVSMKNKWLVYDAALTIHVIILYLQYHSSFKPIANYLSQVIESGLRAVGSKSDESSLISTSEMPSQL